MNAGENEDEQAPHDTKPTRYDECACDRIERGGCACDDDGTVHRRADVEYQEHAPGGFPRRVRRPA